MPAQSTSSELVVNDASTVVIGPDKTPQILQYVLDRSTAKNVKSPHAYALVPGNVVDRTGSYSLGPPPGADTAKAYPMWVDEIGKTVPITYANATQTVHGVAVREWQLKLPATPMAASFVSAMHLPTTMSFADFEAQLKAQGTDLALGLKVLSGSLTAAEKTRLAALTAKPIPLQYFYAITIKLLVEPASGTIVDTLTAVRSYSVRPLSRAVCGRAGAHAGRPPDQPGRRPARRRQREADRRSGPAALRADLPSDSGLGD